MRATIKEVDRQLIQADTSSVPIVPATLTALRRIFYPKYFRTAVKLEDIQDVLIGQLGQFRAIAGELNSEPLNEMLYLYEQPIASAEVPVVGNEDGILLTAPVMFVQSKSGESFVINADFSNEDMKKLVLRLKAKNVPVTVDPSLL